MNELEKPVVVEFPLRGEWLAPTTPGKQIPSHGTDQLGERYAYDFLQVDWQRPGKPFYQSTPLQYLLFGVPLEKCYCWDKEVYAPCDGTVVVARDGVGERQPVHPLADLTVALKNALAFDARRDEVQTVAGNYVVMQCNQKVFAAFAHLRQGSVAVSPGQIVRKGDLLGRVGHSGNSTAPHLHFQLMDSADLLTARGVPCAFERYEVYAIGAWKTVRASIPGPEDRMRFLR